MNRLPFDKRVQILSMLCEGSSMRSTARVVDVSLNTVNAYLIKAGLACAEFHDAKVRNVKTRRVQTDEAWSYIYSKAKNVATAKRKDLAYGDVWTWSAIDADSKLIISYLVGGRDSDFAIALMDDLRARLTNRVQLTTDGHKAYLEAVEGAFGGDIDYSMLIKLYGETPEAEKRYSPAECIGIRKVPIEGDPDPAHISTSYVERSNLSLRTFMRRFTRLTLGFSKKFENHCHMVALYVLWYNFVKMHKTLKMTPALAAGVSDRLWSVEDIVALVDAREPPPKKRGPYKKRQTA